MAVILSSLDAQWQHCVGAFTAIFVSEYTCWGIYQHTNKAKPKAHLEIEVGIEIQTTDEEVEENEELKS